MPLRTVDPRLVVEFLLETAAATWVLGGDGYVIDVPEWAALTGQTPAEVEGGGWMNAIHPDDVDRVQAAWQTAVDHGTLYNTDYRLRCADGRYRWFNARGAPVIDDSGETRQWLGVILSIAGVARPSRGGGARRTTSASRYEDISPGALRAARAMLGWPAERLAEAANISRSTLRRLEEDAATTIPRRASVTKILDVLANERLEFVGENGLISGVVDPSGGGPIQPLDSVS